jgi:hypothetical protein
MRTGTSRSAAPPPRFGPLYKVRLDRIALDVAARPKEVDEIDNADGTISRLVNRALTLRLRLTPPSTRMNSGDPMQES